MNLPNYNYALILASAAAMFTCSKKEHSIDYLGQTPPDTIASLFAPGIISTEAYEHSAPAFSPDGSVVLWTRLDKSYHASMLEMQFENGEWSAPRRPSFADSTADDYYPSFSPDGKKLYFSSRRKLPAGFTLNDMAMWEVPRLPNGWGTPVPMDSVVSAMPSYAHSVTSSGTIYVSGPVRGMNFNIRRSSASNHGFEEAVSLPYDINSVDYEDGPYVAPDESFLIFESLRPEGTNGGLDLYISFREKDNRWTVPVNMGPKINTEASERFARLSPDGRYLFFGSTRNQSSTNFGFDIFWIDAEIIENLRASYAGKNLIDPSMGMDIITAISNDRLDDLSHLLPSWLGAHPNTLDATLIFSSVLRRLGRFAEAEQVLATVPENRQALQAVVIEKALVKFGSRNDEDAEKLLAPILQGEQAREEMIKLSSALLDLRNFKVSDAYFEKAMASAPNMYAYFRRACRLAVLGESDRAFSALGKSIALGNNHRLDYEKNPDLASLKKDPRWNELIKDLK